MPLPKEYKHIHAWHALTGSMQYYIDDLQERASQENAPINAIYFSIDRNKWETIEDVKNLEMKAAVEDWLLKRER